MKDHKDLLEYIAKGIKQYNEEVHDLLDEPIAVKLMIGFHDFSHPYSWNGEKFKDTRYEVPKDFRKAMKELEDKGYVVGCSYRPKIPRDRKADEMVHTITIYSEDDIPFGIYNGVTGLTDGTVQSEWGADLNNEHFSFASGFGIMGPFGPGEFDENSSIGGFGADPSLALSQSVIVTQSGAGAYTSYHSEVIILEPGAIRVMGAGPLIHP